MRIKRKTLIVSLVVAGIVASFLFAAQAKSRAEQRIYERTIHGVDAARSIAAPETKERIGKAVLKLARIASVPQSNSTTLDEWIHNLMLVESRGRTTFSENGGLPYIIDVNGKRSYSCLQFQEGTFNAYSKRYGIEGSIEDCGTQKLLAKAMIQGEPGAWRHWLNSSKRIGTPPKS